MTTQGAGLRNAADDEQLAYCVAQGRAIITQDDDFLRMAAAGTDHPGVVSYHQPSRTIGQVIRGVHLIWEVYEPGEMRNRVEFI